MITRASGPQVAPAAAGSDAPGCFTTRSPGVRGGLPPRPRDDHGRKTLMSRTRTGAELVQDFVATFEIEYVFGNPGTTETTFLAALAGSQATLCARPERTERGRDRGRVLAGHRQDGDGEPAHLPGPCQRHVQPPQRLPQRDPPPRRQRHRRQPLPDPQPGARRPQHPAGRDRDEVPVRGPQHR